MRSLQQRARVRGRVCSPRRVACMALMALGCAVLIRLSSLTPGDSGSLVPTSSTTGIQLAVVRAPQGDSRPSAAPATGTATAPAGGAATPAAALPTVAITGPQRVAAVANGAPSLAGPMPPVCRASLRGPSAPSVLVEVTSQALRDAAGTGPQELASMASAAPCFWANLTLPQAPFASPRDVRSEPVCIQDPAVDRVESLAIHQYGAYNLGAHADLVALLPEDTCPPDRPVVLDLGLGLGVWSMYAIDRGCQVVAFSPSLDLVQRAVQSMARARDGRGRPMVESLHAFHNRLGDAPSTSGGVHTVSVEDLLYKLPESQRPQVWVTHRLPSGREERVRVPLQAHHVSLVRIDVGDANPLVVQSLRQLIAGPVRPLGLSINLTPSETQLVGCDAMAVVKLMYDNGYGYSKSRHSIQLPDDARVPLETMVQDVDLSAQGWEVSSKRGVPRTFDGWWLQAGVSLLRPVGGNGRGAVAAGPVLDAAPAPLTNMVHHVIPAVLSSADIAAGDVCNTSVPEGATSTFSQVTSDELQRAAVRASDGNAEALAEVERLLAPLAANSPCFWASYKFNNDGPGGPRVARHAPMCTHDPTVDTVISRSIHDSSAWFPGTVEWELGEILPGGACPPDRPVALDLGLNIGSWAMLALNRGCHVVAFDILSENVNRVVQTVARAKGEDGRLYLERFSAFQNGVNNVPGAAASFKHHSNIGTSAMMPLESARRLGKDISSVVNIVTPDDLFSLPEAQRPNIRVRRVNPATGALEAVWERLRPEHVFVVKVDVEGFDGPALHGMRRLLSSPLPPHAITAEFTPEDAMYKGCDSEALVRFLYSKGYEYNAESGGKLEDQAMPLEATLTQIRNSLAGWEARETNGAPRTFEGWWLQRRRP